MKNDGEVSWRGVPRGVVDTLVRVVPVLLDFVEKVVAGGANGLVHGRDSGHNVLILALGELGCECLDNRVRARDVLGVSIPFNRPPPSRIVKTVERNFKSIPRTSTFL